LYGGRHGVVYAIHGEQRPDAVGTVTDKYAAGSFNGSEDIYVEAVSA
jgi:hypothetical protein